MVEILTALLFALGAHATDCRLSKAFSYKNKTYGPCEITGDSGAGKVHDYQLHCEGLPEIQHLEYQKGSAEVTLLDSSTRYVVTKCPVEKSLIEEMIKTYDTRVHAIENPPCYLTQWNGQMVFVAHSTRGRCTFDMKKEQAEEFKKKTGVEPLYQCEKGYFLVMPKNAAAEIYKPAKGKWESECKAPTKVGEKVDQIDWKNPPNYYHP